MSSEPRQIEEIVRAALTMPADEREVFVADICGSDDDLRRRVETWLRIRGSGQTPRTGNPANIPASYRPPGAARWAVPLLIVCLLLALGGIVWLGLAVAAAREQATQAGVVARQEAEQANRLVLEKERATRAGREDRLALEFVVTHLLTRNALDTAEAKVAEVAKESATLEALLREAIGTAALARGETRRALTQLRLAAKERDNPALAARLAEAEAAEAQRADPATLRRLRAQIDAFEKQQQLDKSESLLRELVAILRDNAQDPLDVAATEVLLGRNLLTQEKHAAAEAVLRAALTRAERGPVDEWVAFDIRSMLGAALLGQKRYEDAEPLLVAGYEGLKEREDLLAELLRPRVTDAGKRVLALYEAWNKPAKIALWKRKLGL